MVMQSLEYNIRELNARYHKALSLIEQAKMHETQGEQKQAMNLYLHANNIISSAWHFQRGVTYHVERISLDTVNVPRFLELNVYAVLALNFEALLPQIQKGLDGRVGEEIKMLDQLRRRPSREEQKRRVVTFEAMFEREGWDPYSKPPSRDEVANMIGRATGYVSLPDAVSRSREK